MTGLDLESFLLLFEPTLAAGLCWAWGRWSCVYWRG